MKNKNISFLYCIKCLTIVSSILLAHYTSSAQFNWNPLIFPTNLYSQTSIAISEDDSHAITVGGYHSYYTSIDSGNTWVRGRIPRPGFLTSVTYFSRLGILASDDNGMIFRSTDHGVQWNEIVVQQGISITCIRRVQDSIILCTTEDGKIFRSTDSGILWNLVFEGQHALQNIAIGKNGHILIVGDNGTILQSSNIGVNWISTEAKAPEKIKLKRVAHVYDSTWMIAGDTSYLARTTDNGRSWEYIVPDTSQKNRRYNASTLTFTNNGIGVFTEYDVRNNPTAHIYCTWDGGKTWKFGYNVFFDGYPEVFSMQGIQFFKQSTKGIIAGYFDRISKMNVLSDTSMYAYERITLVGALTDIFYTSIFIAGASKTSYFRTIDSSRMQVLREYDDKGNELKTWRFKDSSIKFKYVHAQKFDDNHAIIYSDSMLNIQNSTTQLLFTSDGGESWRVSKPDTIVNKFNRGYWKNYSNGVLTSKSGFTAYKTVDAGYSWKKIDYPAEYESIKIESFNSDSTAYIAFGTKKADKSIDLLRLSEDLVWTPILTDLPKGRLITKDANHMIINYSGKVYLIRLNNSAMTGLLQLLGTDDGWLSKPGVSMFLNDTLIHASNDYDFRYSIDSGLTFIKMIDPFLSSMSKALAGSSWSLDRPGTIFSLNNSIIINIVPGGMVLKGEPSELITNIQETTSDIYTNPPYPNPFSKSTTIAVDWLFTLSAQSLTLKVYNAIGEEVRDLTKDLHAHAQNYRSSLIFDAGNLPDGVYYVVCKGGNHTSTQRLIITR